METCAHQRLKDVAVAFLWGAGCRAVATEVSCPISRYRVDVAGYIDPLPKSARRYNSREDRPIGGGAPRTGEGRGAACAALRRESHAKTVLIECKQDRADFLRDSARLDRLLAERDSLDRARRRLEDTLIRRCEPQLRRSESALFPELEDWDFGASRLESYREVLRQLRRLDKRLHGQTKFWTAARYRLGDVLLLAAPAGMIRVREVPPGWGLLEVPRARLERPGVDGRALGELLVSVPGDGGRSKPELQHRVLRNIAVAATRASLGAAARGPGFTAVAEG